MCLRDCEGTVELHSSDMDSTIARDTWMSDFLTLTLAHSDFLTTFHETPIEELVPVHMIKVRSSPVSTYIGSDIFNVQLANVIVFMPILLHINPLPRAPKHSKLSTSYRT